MKINLDHFIVPSRDKNASAKLLAELFGVAWEGTGKTNSPLRRQSLSPYEQYRSERATVYLNDTLTLDFMDKPEPRPRLHYCFRVNGKDFDTALSKLKAAGIPFRSDASGPADADHETAGAADLVRSAPKKQQLT